MAPWGKASKSKGKAPSGAATKSRGPLASKSPTSQGLGSRRDVNGPELDQIPGAHHPVRPATRVQGPSHLLFDGAGHQGPRLVPGDAQSGQEDEGAAGRAGEEVGHVDVVGPRPQGGPVDDQLFQASRGHRGVVGIFGPILHLVPETNEEVQIHLGLQAHHEGVGFRGHLDHVGPVMIREGTHHPRDGLAGHQEAIDPQARCILGCCQGVPLPIQRWGWVRRPKLPEEGVPACLPSPDGVHGHQVGAVLGQGGFQEGICSAARVIVADEPVPQETEEHEKRVHIG